MCQESALRLAFIFINLRDNFVGAGGKCASVRVNVGYSEVEEEVDEKGPNVLCKKYLRKNNKLGLRSCQIRSNRHIIYAKYLKYFFINKKVLFFKTFSILILNLVV